jgi:hypothetical protein
MAPIAPEFLALSPAESQIGLSLLRGSVVAMVTVAVEWWVAGGASTARLDAMQLLCSMLAGGLICVKLAVSGSQVW